MRHSRFSVDGRLRCPVAQKSALMLVASTAGRSIVLFAMPAGARHLCEMIEDRPIDTLHEASGGHADRSRRSGTFSLSAPEEMDAGRVKRNVPEYAVGRCRGVV